MKSFTLSRIEMSSLLLSLTKKSDQQPMDILQKAWVKFHLDHELKMTSLTEFLSTEVPPMLPKIINAQGIRGLSIGEIAALGHLIEFSTLSVAAMQNWVKRDFKEYLGSPREGKKYSVNQAILLFMIDDLKATLDFESIRKLFDRLFLSGSRKVELIEPVQLYYAYSSLFEKAKNGTVEQSLEKLVLAGSNEVIIKQLNHLEQSQKETVCNMMRIAALSVQTSYFQALARQYFDGK